MLERPAIDIRCIWSRHTKSRQIDRHDDQNQWSSPLLWSGRSILTTPRYFSPVTYLGNCTIVHGMRPASQRCSYSRRIQPLGLDIWKRDFSTHDVMMLRKTQGSGWESRHSIVSRAHMFLLAPHWDTYGLSLYRYFRYLARSKIIGYDANFRSRRSFRWAAKSSRWSNRRRLKRFIMQSEQKCWHTMTKEHKTTKKPGVTHRSILGPVSFIGYQLPSNESNAVSMHDCGVD